MPAAARCVGVALIAALVVAPVVSAAGRQDEVIGTSLLTAARAAADAVAATEPRSEPAGHKRKRCLETSKLERARQFAAHRSGSVSFAFLDECHRLVGEHRYRVYSSASVIKVMLLAAYLRQDEVAARELDDGERDLLGRMIEQSDNGAADSVFAAVGEAGLDEVADAAGMRRFESSPYWGGSAITAADQASFLGRLERYVPRRHEDYALRVLGNVIDEQRWGIPEVKPRHWSVHFKGGWYPVDGAGWRVNQVATLRRGSRGFALAVLSEGNPSFVYGEETVRGVAKRLMGGYRR